MSLTLAEIDREPEDEDIDKSERAAIFPIFKLFCLLP